MYRAVLTAGTRKDGVLRQLEQIIMNENDFKYVIDGLTEILFGTAYTYGEIIADEMISYKFRCVCRQYFTQEVAEDTSIESHLYYLTEDMRSFGAFKQMKTKVSVLVPSGSAAGNAGDGYTQRTLPIADLVRITPQQKEAMGMIIREISVSKLGLMTFVL